MRIADKMKKLFLLLLSIIILTSIVTGCDSLVDDIMSELMDDRTSSAGSSDNGMSELSKADYSNEQLGLRFTVPQGFVITDGDDPAEISPAVDTVSEIEVESRSGDTTLFILSYEFPDANEDDILAMHRAMTEEIRFKYEGDFTIRQIAGQDFWHGKSSLSFLGFSLIQEENIAIRNNRVYLITILYSPDAENERDALMAGFSE